MGWGQGLGGPHGLGVGMMRREDPWTSSTKYLVGGKQSDMFNRKKC